MTFAMANAEVLSDERAVAIWEVATKDLLGGMVELMTVEMLGARVTLAAAFMSTFKFAI